MRSTSTRAFILAPALATGLILAFAIARASACSGGPSAGPTTTSANDAPALDLGDCPDDAGGLSQGKAYLCACPAQAEAAPVFGSDVYAENSGICSAAVHAGMLKQEVPGQVLFHVIASPPVFKGATRNGVKSEVWPQPAEAAFQFERLRAIVCSLGLGSFA